jgi:hypothetical protein
MIFTNLKEQHVDVDMIAFYPGFYKGSKLNLESAQQMSSHESDE